MKLCITSLGKDAFDLDVLETDTLFDLKALIRERLALEGPKKQGLKLVHDTSLLENDIESLSSYGLEDGSSLLLLLENPGPIRLEAHVSDRTPEDSLLTAAESGELQHPVSKIEVTVGTFQDQDWGNCKGNLFLSLLKGDLVLVRQNLYGTYRLDGYPHGRHPPPLTFTESDDLVRLAEVGCRYQIAYTVGSGGGHRIEVKDWTCTIHYVSSSATEPSEIVQCSRGRIRRTVS